MLVVDEILAAGELDENQAAMVFKLMKLLEHAPRSEPESSLSSVISDSKVTYVKIPHQRKKEEKLATRQARRRSKWLNGLMKRFDAGPKAVEGGVASTPGVVRKSCCFQVEAQNRARC